MAKVDFNGTTYDDFDIYKRKLLVQGVQPTDFTSSEGQVYDYVDIIVLEPNRKDGAIGKGSANYRYGTAEHINEFADLKFPCVIDVDMTNGTDKKGNSIGIVLAINFESVVEMELVPRTTQTTNTKTISQTKHSDITITGNK